MYVVVFAYISPAVSSAISSAVLHDQTTISLTVFCKQRNTRVLWQPFFFFAKDVGLCFAGGNKQGRTVFILAV